MGGVLASNSFSYDDYARLTNATLAGSSHTFGYDNADRLISLSYASGITRTDNYNTDGTLSSSSVTDSSSTTLEALTYSFNTAKNITSYSDNDGTQSFSYDGLGRLTGADYPDSTSLNDEAFTYDGVGNREDPSDGSAYEYNNNNQLVSQNNEALIRSYDDGSLTSITGAENKTFAYDLENRLTSYTDGSTIASYGYGVSGRRLFKTVDGTTTWFLWNGAQLIAEFKEDGNTVSLTKRYDFLPDNYTPLQVTDAYASYSVYSDHLSTPRLIINRDGESIWRSSRTAFGETVTNNDVDGDGQVVVFNMRFPGQYYDEESGLHYNYFRDYDPSTGRYLQSDPIGLQGGLNIYGYVEGNPVSNIDPFGLLTVPGGAECKIVGNKMVCTEPREYEGLSCEQKASSAYRQCLDNASTTRLLCGTALGLLSKGAASTRFAKDVLGPAGGAGIGLAGGGGGGFATFCSDIQKDFGQKCEILKEKVREDCECSE
ncbi:RHS repeat domain-containing protein [Microbulbifer sp. TRSA001]|uniref:RHS repeat domain-containing protein n=1 Tax=Microbulbifer sp. TRSA001 TaxID=3243381 RepID=UPI00403939BF